MDTAEQLLSRDGKPVPKALEMLVALVERSGHLVEKEELMKVVWADAFVEESNLTNSVLRCDCAVRTEAQGVRN